MLKDDIRRRVECEMLEYSTAIGMQKPDLSTCFFGHRPIYWPTFRVHAAKVLQRAL